MTPLAHAIVADSTLPVKRRQFRDQSGLLPRLRDAHCFEVTSIMDSAGDLAQSAHDREQTLRGVYSFLPAPLTWIEWRHDNGFRQGFLLDDVAESGIASSTWAGMGEGHFLSAKRKGGLILSGDASVNQEYLAVRDFDNDTDADRRGYVALAYALLAMINTPRVIGRRQHMPHAGLQRKLAAAHRMPGKYPLQAWHELVLEVAPPRVTDEEPHEVRLTGAKAQHFVRCHLRLRLGHLELVSSHWRGDPALGIKQTRYRVVPPRAAA